MAVREQEERSTGLNIQVSWETRAWVWREEDDMVELQKLDRWDRQMERRVSEHLPSETVTSHCCCHQGSTAQQSVV